MGTCDAHDYLNEYAANLLADYPNCGEYISELLTKYKKTLKDGSVDIGRTPDEVMLNFARDVRKRCLQDKTVSTDRPPNSIRK